MPDNPKPDLTAYIGMIKHEITEHVDKEIERILNLGQSIEATLHHSYDDLRDELKVCAYKEVVRMKHSAEYYMDGIRDYAEKEMKRRTDGMG